jgi:hypothetical protein
MPIPRTALRPSGARTASPTSYYGEIGFDSGSAVWTSPVWFER